MVLNNQKYALFIIFIIAFTIRLIAIANLPLRFSNPDSDPKQYDTLAVNLLSGKGYTIEYYNFGRPTSYRAPLYPLFLASIYSIFGHNYLAVRVIQSIFGAILCILVYFIARSVFNNMVGLIAAISLAVYKPFISYSFYGGPGFLYAENLFTPLLAVLILFLVSRFLVKPISLTNQIIAGVLIGLASLTRPVIALLPFFLILLLLIQRTFSPKKILFIMAPLFLSFGIVMLPWIALNYIVHKEFVPFTTEGGPALLAGNNIYASGDGLCDLGILFDQKQKTMINSLSEVKQDKFYRSEALNFLFTHWKVVPKLFLKKLLVFWDLYDTGYDENGAMYRKYNIWYSIVFMFGLYGIIKILKPLPTPKVLLLLSIFVYFSILSMVFLGEPRFRNPVEPILIIFASYGIFSIYEKKKHILRSSLLVFCVVLLNLVIYKYSDLILSFVRHYFSFLIKM